MTANDPVQDALTHAIPRQGGFPAPSTVEFTVESEGFSGTLPELAQALRSGRLQASELDVLALVRRYLAYFEALAERDLDLASEALPLVARIVELKVRFLLPRPPVADEADEQLGEETLEVVMLLEELEAAIRFLKDRREARRVVLSARAPRPDYPRPERSLTVGVGKLREVAARYTGSAYFELALERFSMADAMKGLLRRLRAVRRGRLLDLLEQRSWAALCVTFAGMLELHKEGKLRAIQQDAYGPIEIEVAGATEVAEVAEQAEAA